MELRVHVQYMYTVTLDFKVILIVVGIIFDIKPEDLMIIIIIIIIFMEYTNYALSCPTGWALIRIGSVTNSNRFCLRGNACMCACLLSNEE